MVHEEVGDDEVHFRENEQRVESPIPPIPVTTIDMDVIIRGWEEKFEHLSRCLRDVQLASDKANSDMCDVTREGRARGIEQERRLQAMHVGITDFLHKCEPTHLSATRQDSAPTASTQYGRPQGYLSDCARNSISAQFRPWIIQFEAIARHQAGQ